MKSADRLLFHQLEDLEATITHLRRVFPEAIRSAEDAMPRPPTGVPVRSSTISDPTASLALDPRRRARAHNVKMARRRVKGALVALGEALAHAALAADRG